MLTVCLLTAHRFEYAQTTLHSTLKNIVCDKVNVHVASDGDDIEYIKRLCNIARLYTNVEQVTWSDSGGKGYGANYNLAMQQVHMYGDFVLPLEDDWELVNKLPVSELMNDLNNMGGGCIRLGYVGFTQELRGIFVDGNYIHLDPFSPEPHVFAGHPRIESVDWSRAVGEWPEDLNPGSTEFSVAHRPMARNRVYVPLHYLDSFVHIGAVRSY